MQDVVKLNSPKIKKYICPRCDDLLDANYPSELCHNCGGFVRGIVPAKRDWPMPEVIEWSLKSVIKGLLLLFVGLTILVFVFVLFLLFLGPVIFMGE